MTMDKDKIKTMLDLLKGMEESKRIHIYCNKMGKIVVVPKPECNIPKHGLENLARIYEKVIIDHGLKPSDIGLPLAEERIIKTHEPPKNEDTFNDKEEPSADDAEKDTLDHDDFNDHPDSQKQTQDNLDGDKPSAPSTASESNRNHSARRQLNREEYEQLIQKAMQAEWEIKAPDECSKCGSTDIAQIITSPKGISALCDDCSI